MSFNITGFIFNPFILIFSAIFLGMLFGRIKIKNFSFGAAGPLFVGLLISYGVLTYAHSLPPESAHYQQAQRLIQGGLINPLLFDTFLILFVTTIGLLASNTIVTVIRKYGLQFVALGFIITAVGAITNYTLTRSFPDSESFKVSGTYSGAMTSSPSLAAALEKVGQMTREEATDFGNLPAKKQQLIISLLNKNVADKTKLTPTSATSLTETEQQRYVALALADVGVGHSISFPIGSLVVIFSMAFMHRVFRINLDNEKRQFAQLMAPELAKEVTPTDTKPANIVFDITGFALAVIVGLAIGTVKVSLGSLGHLSLGATGGALMGGLALGTIGRIGFIHFRMNTQVLQVIRTLCLIIFLAIVGLRFGYAVVDSLTGSGGTIVMVGFITAFMAIMSGFLVGRYVMKLNYILLAGALCGGMTNTTGMGTLVDVLGSDDAATGYGATFPFALIGMVIFTILLHQFL